MKKILLWVLVLAAIFPVWGNGAWSLDSCINYAVSHNLTVKSRELNVRNAELTVTEAKDAFLPNLSGGAQQSFSFGRGLTQENMYANRNTSQFGWSVQMSMPLFQGLRDVRNLDYSRANYRMIIEELESAKDNITLSVIAQYLQVLYCKEMYDVAMEQVRLSEFELNRRKELVEAGKIPELDILQAQAQLSQDELTAVSANNDLDLALLDLSQMLELETPEGFDVEPLSVSMIELPLMRPEEVYESALSGNHSVKASRLAVDVADKYIKLAQSGYLPTLSFSAGLGSSYYKTSGFDNESFLGQMRHNLSQSLGFSLNIPIFDSFSTRNNVRKAKVQQLSAQLQLKETELQLYKTIQQAYTQAVAANKRKESSAVAEKSTRASFDAIREKYNYGKANATEFEQAQTEYIKAVSQSVQAKYESVLRRRILAYYMGN
ncbi:MAG: TolC family protein [Muribaculaceae bacterium]|nr:TolC family protein [Muribaculaceae bacterium]